MIMGETEREDVAASTDPVEELPKRYRMPVWLCRVEGFSMEEAAEILSLPRFLVRLYVGRGLRMMRQRPNEWDGRAGDIADSVVREAAPVTLLNRIDGMVRCPDREEGTEGLPWRDRLGPWIAFWGALAMLLTGGEIRRAMTEAMIRWLGG